MVCALAAWSFFGRLFLRASRHQDFHPELGLAMHDRLNRYSVFFVLVFAASLTMGAFDWLISLDPGWFSTMFAVYVFAGTFVQGIPSVPLALVTFSKMKPLPHSPTPHH